MRIIPNNTEVIAIEKTIGKIIKYSLKKFRYDIINILTNEKQNIKENKANNIFSKKISQTILNDNKKKFSKEIDNIIRHLLSIIKNSNLENSHTQKEIFDQILIYLNKSKFDTIFNTTFNTISKNELKDFKDLTIGEELNIILNNNYGVCCRHKSTILFNLFEKLEESGLDISKIIFLEKIDRSDHIGFLIKFQGNIYLVDPSRFNGKIIQPLNAIKKQEKFNTKKINREASQCIGDLQKYKEGKEILYFQDYFSLFNTYEKLPQDIGKFSSRTKGQYNSLLERLTGIKIYFFNNGLLFQNGIFFKFGEDIKKIKDLNIDEINDNELTDLLINNINGKKIIKKGSHINGKYTPQDKEILKRQLLYIIKRINKHQLLEIIKNPENQFDK